MSEDCTCSCHNHGYGAPRLLKATVEDVRYLTERLSSMVGELECLVGRRPPHPRRSLEDE